MSTAKSKKETNYDLKEYFKDREFSFLLGAGATDEVGFPKWTVLVKNLCDEMGLSEIAVTQAKVIEIVGAIENNRISDIWENKLPPQLVGLREFLKKREDKDTENDIKKLLLRSNAQTEIAAAVAKILQTAKKTASARSKRSKNSLMNTIATICSRRTKKKMRTSVVTYNYDDYFEYCYKNTTYKYKLRIHDFLSPNHPIIRKPDCHGVDIYHVHGRLPVFEDALPIMRSYNEGIILSSNDYSELLGAQEMGWTNQVQHSIFSALPIMIVGFSMEDPNFRAIISRLRSAKMLDKAMVMILGHDSSSADKKRAANEKYLIRKLLSPFDDKPPMLDILVCEFTEIPALIRKYLM